MRGRRGLAKRGSRQLQRPGCSKKQVLPLQTHLPAPVSPRETKSWLLSLFPSSLLPEAPCKGWGLGKVWGRTGLGAERRD